MDNPKKLTPLEEAIVARQTLDKAKTRERTAIQNLIEVQKELRAAEKALAEAMKDSKQKDMIAQRS